MSSDSWVLEESNVRETRFRDTLPGKGRNEDQVVSEKKEKGGDRDTPGRDITSKLHGQNIPLC